jgi:hypothetical protein
VDVTDRDKYRDNDDMRDPAEDRVGTDPDTKAEGRGDAREAVGNTKRGTAADPTGPDGNDKTRHRPRPDVYDSDLARDNQAQSDRRDSEITES